MRRILALDSADGACSVALWLDGAVVARGDAEAIEGLTAMPRLAAEFLADAGLGWKQLDALACSRGPGGFTGVRVAVGLAQGLALGAGLPVIPVSSLSALAIGAWQLHPGRTAVCALDARMGELYGAVFAADQPCASLVPEALLTATDAAARLGMHAGAVAAGRGFSAWPDLAAAVGAEVVLADLRPHAATVAELAAALGLAAACDPQDLEPVYLRNEVAQARTRTPQ